MHTKFKTILCLLLALGGLVIISQAAHAGQGIDAPANGWCEPGAGEGGKPAGVVCQQAGLSTLLSLGLLSAVAGNGIMVDGVGVVDFATVLELHRTMPELFQTGGVSVIIGDETVPATWCD